MAEAGAEANGGVGVREVLVLVADGVGAVRVKGGAIADDSTLEGPVVAVARSTSAVTADAWVMVRRTAADRVPATTPMRRLLRSRVILVPEKGRGGQSTG